MLILRQYNQDLILTIGVNYFIFIFLSNIATQMIVINQLIGSIPCLFSKNNHVTCISFYKKSVNRNFKNLKTLATLFYSCKTLFSMIVECNG